MDTLILYRSKMGSTKKYAEDIASRVGADVMPLKRRFPKNKIKDYDIIVFGGWIMGGNIQGLNDFLSYYDLMKDKEVIVFACGLALPTQSGRNDLIEKNVLDLYHVRFYQFRGNFNLKKLHFPYSWLIKHSLDALLKEERPGTDVNYVNELLSRSVEVYDQNKVDKVCSVIETLRLRKKSETNSSKED